MEDNPVPVPSTAPTPVLELAQNLLIKWQPGVLLVLIVVAAYLPALFCGFFWDDHAHIELNSLLTAPGGLYRIWFSLSFQQYLPIQLSTHWLEVRLWGFNPLPFHAANVLLHAINGVLVWQVLKRLEFKYAWQAAALFSLHPVAAETVVWVTERRTLLSAMFYLGAVLCWMNFSDGRGQRWYAATLGLYTLALLSKTVACTLPVILFLLDWMRAERRPPPRIFAKYEKSVEKGIGIAIATKELISLIPFFIVGLPLSMLTALMEREIIGAQGYLWDYSLAQRILLCGRALWFYVFKDLLPIQLTFIYPRWHLDGSDVFQWLWLIAAIIAAIALLPLSRQFGRRAVMPVIFFAITLFPALGFANIYPQRFSFVADHFQYLACLGIVVLFTGIVAWLYESARGNKGTDRTDCLSPHFHGTIPRVAGWAVLLIFGCLVWSHARSFMSDESMWKDVLSKNNEAWLADVNLGVIYYDGGHPEEALPYYEKAYELQPDDMHVASDLADTYVRLGNTERARQIFTEALKASPAFEMTSQAAVKTRSFVSRTFRNLVGLPAGFLTIYEQQCVNNTMDVLLGLANVEGLAGHADEAQKNFEAAMKLRPKNNKPYLARAAYLKNLGKSIEAFADLEKAALLDVSDAEPLYQKGTLLLSTGQVEKAMAAFHEALERNPHHSATLCELGAQLQKKGALEEAISYYRKAISADPKNINAYYDLGWAFQLESKDNEAESVYDALLTLQPNHAETLNNVGSLMVKRHDWQMAERYYRAAITAHPGFLDASSNLAVALTQLGRFDEAAELLKGLKKTNPKLPGVYLNLSFVLGKTKKYSEVATALHEGIAALGADSAQSLPLRDALAWLMATCPEDKIRNGAEAVRILQSGSPAKGAQALDTLAAAYAENADFKTAQKTAHDALAMAQKEGKNGLAEKIAERLKLYEKNLPYHEIEATAP